MGSGLAVLPPAASRMSGELKSTSAVVRSARGELPGDLTAPTGAVCGSKSLLTRTF
jgi:hypothetical protein